MDTLLEECQASHEKRLAEKQNELRRVRHFILTLILTILTSFGSAQTS